MKDIATKSNNISSLSAEEFNNVQQEHENSITTSGQTLDEFNLFQQAEMVARYASTGGVFYQDSGVADAYVLLPLGSFVAPAVYLDGMEGVFKTVNASTGASTINIAGIGVKSLVLPDGTALSTEITANEYHSVRFNDADDRVELVNVSGGGEAGLVKQIKSTTKTDTSSTTSTTRADIPGLSVTVTGLVATDDILITGTVFMGAVVNDRMFGHIDADGTEIGQGDASGSKRRCHTANGGIQIFNEVTTFPFNFLYQPATTGSVTIKLQFSSETGTVIYVNRSSNDADVNTVPRTASTLTATVISGG